MQAAWLQCHSIQWLQLSIQPAFELTPLTALYMQAKLSYHFSSKPVYPANNHGQFQEPSQMLMTQHRATITALDSNL